MSVDAVAWALRKAPVLNAQEHVLLIALADRADEHGRGAWPYQADLAAAGRCSIRTARRHLSAMEDRGLIRRGDQRIVAHLRGDQRPIVWDLDLSLRLSAPVPVGDSSDSGEREDILSARPDLDFLATGERGDKMTGRTNGVSDAPNDRPDNLTDRTELCPNDRTELCPPIRPLRPSSSYVEEVSPVGSARDNETPPPRHCDRHPKPAEGCDDCRAAHRDRFEWTSERIGIDIAPPPRCVQHLDDPNPPNCGGCKEARLAREAWDAAHARRVAEGKAQEIRRAAAVQASAIAACGRCDADGFIEPTIRCTHDPSDTERARKGMAAVRAAMKWDVAS
ncbi:MULTISPECIES: helix-turn-helix domain-containing protein [Nocardia]|uniref:helix-turn-helix domain-containing protein n=1 Tax=Nocardia TaxID=1817 RepID=UPI0024546B91|nr:MULTISPECIES: helix-turn-helix domain-containing protein [Nocardia]